MIPLLTIQNDFDEYLEHSFYIDWDEPEIKKMATELKQSENEIETVRKCYEFVRDQIRHSWDAQDRRITAKASEVLREKVGICWAKSNLLTALLRANQIPAGICYQRLTLGDLPETGYCIHALNAVFMKSVNQWIRLDARGNKPGISAEMNLKEEYLAFQIREEFGEIDYKIVYAKPLPVTMNILENSTDALYMYEHSLPDKI